MQSTWSDGNVEYMLSTQMVPEFLNSAKSLSFQRKKITRDRLPKIPKSTPSMTLEKGMGVTTFRASIAGGISSCAGWGFHVFFRMNGPQAKNVAEQ